MPSGPRRPLPFVLASTNHGTMIVNRNDYVMTAPDRGFGMGYQLLNLSSFDPEEIDICVNLLNNRRRMFGSGVVALDCGANVGTHSVEMARSMHGWGSVISFEAQERVYYALAGNIAINNCFNATAHWAAVGASVGELSIPVPNYLIPSSFGSLELKKQDRRRPEYIGQDIDYASQARITVRQLSIDSLKLARIDFIKIDVEGMEIEVLQGATEALAAHKPQMLIEFIKSDTTAIRDLLGNLGYRMLTVGINILAIHNTDPGFDAVKVVTKAP